MSESRMHSQLNISHPAGDFGCLNAVLLGNEEQLCSDTSRIPNLSEPIQGKGRQQTYAYGTLNVNMTAKAACDRHLVNIIFFQPRFAEQDICSGAYGRLSQLNLSDITLGDHDILTSAGALFRGENEFPALTPLASLTIVSQPASFVYDLPTSQLTDGIQDAGAADAYWRVTIDDLEFNSFAPNLDLLYGTAGSSHTMFDATAFECRPGGAG
jgi:hypothetical protein